MFRRSDYVDLVWNIDFAGYRIKLEMKELCSKTNPLRLLER